MIIIIAIETALTGLMAFADSHSGERPPVLGKTVILHMKVISNRPNAPSLFKMECTFGERFVTCTFPENVHTISVRLYNEREMYSDILTEENYIMEIPSLCGEYIIECDSDNGRTYTGTLIF